MITTVVLLLFVGLFASLNMILIVAMDYFLTRIFR